MTIRTFWTTFLKIIGVYLLIACFAVIPQFFSSLLFLYPDDTLEQMGMTIFILAATLAMYILVIRVFLFKTAWLIDRLKLTEGFLEERIDTRISSHSIINIAIIVVGGLLLIESLPSLVREVFEFFQQTTIFRESPGAGWIIFHLIKSVIGYVLLTNSKPMADIIARKTPTTIDEQVAVVEEPVIELHEPHMPGANSLVDKEQE